MCRAPLLPVLRSRFPKRPEARGRARGGELAGTRGSVGGRVRGAGVVSPRGAEPGRLEALSPAKGPLCRRRGARVLRISRPRGIGTVSRARRPPRSLLAASRLLGAHQTPGFQRRPGARSSCGDGTPGPARPRALRARRLPRGRGFPERPAERQPQPGRCGRWRRRRTGKRGCLGYWLRRPSRLQPEGRGTPSEAASPSARRAQGRPRNYDLGSTARAPLL